MLRDGEEAMSIGKSFQTEAPATGKVRLPMVESRQRGTSSLWDAAERKFECRTVRDGSKRNRKLFENAPIV